ncbi:GMC oxidoreductase [Agaribacter flavus]|uniref:GMC oxidoreductase n=1 Tax=Agaribacter flavus TaxID=1902781 RepID=A0ABV7FRW2_9ALTE
MADSINTDTYDVIVVGSGITGGWAAKEFCEKGYKTLVLERGRHLDHPDKEYTDMLQPWQMYNRAMMPEIYQEEGRYQDLKEKSYPYWSHVSQFFVDEKDFPYSNPEDKPFMWTRGYQLGGRSITWGRQSYRWGPKDFEANAKDGHGIPWPIGYEDIAPWYDYVEEFAGISGNKDSIDSLPDGQFLKPWPMSAAEQFVAQNVNASELPAKMIIGRCANLSETTPTHQKLGRGPCQARNQCSQGCTFGAYFCSLSSTLPAARKTGNLTIVTDAIVESVVQDEISGKAVGVRAINQHSKNVTTYHARVVFLCASALASLQIMLNSKSRRSPEGIANSSGMLGHYIMDHFGGAGAYGTVPGFEDKYSFGRRPTNVYIPNFRHEKQGDVDFIRGYGYQGDGSNRPRQGHTGERAGIGANVKGEVGKPLPWRIGIGMFGELLPYFDNQVSLHTTKKDAWGIPQLHIEAHGRENEKRMLVQAAEDAKNILIAGGCTNVQSFHPDVNQHIQIGTRTHEMGGACMGADPNKSVLNKWCQAHDVPNLFVTDGACMSSCATQNPSLTYMALTARAANYAANLLQEGKL